MSSRARSPVETGPRGRHGPLAGERWTYELTRAQRVPRPLAEAFAFFADARNLELLTPPWLAFRIVDAPETLSRGSTIGYRLRLIGVSLRWRSEIAEWEPPGSFTDVQRRGPYARWEHTHRFAAVGDTTEVVDRVVYRPPGGPLAPLVRTALVRGQLERIFDYRAARIEEIFSAD